MSKSHPKTFNVTRAAHEANPARSLSFDYPLGDSVDEAVNLFGADAVLRLFKRAATDEVTAEARRLLRYNRAGQPVHTDEEALAKLASWRVGTDAAAVERAQALTARLASLPPDAVAAAGVKLS